MECSQYNNLRKDSVIKTSASEYGVTTVVEYSVKKQVPVSFLNIKTEFQNMKTELHITQLV